ncbi:MAG: SH3 domain-containing protein [Candidatus Moranbacteria bacterium]|nr:SH3 domain-containing protein [Candidatus Moranbacteria bacterium]
MLKEKCEKIYGKIKNWAIIVRDSSRRHFPLVLAIIFLTPAFILLFLFVNSQLHKQSSYAATFTGKVKVSKQTTTLSTSGDWYTSMAHSGDGVNGDAESGTFNPIHPGQGAGTEPGAGGIAMGHVAMGATTTYAAAQFIGFKPSATGNLDGVQLVFENLTSTNLSNVDLVVEFVRFPSATYSGGWTNYVTGTQGAYTYPSDTQVLRRTVWQFNQELSGENAAPGQFGRATFDFRFDPPVAVTTGGGAGDHYGIRIINMGASTPVFGTWAQAPQSNGFPSINGTIRTIGFNDLDTTNAPTVTMPVVLGGNTVLTTGAMVAANSVPGIGLPTVRRTENEHWTATYSSANGNWTVAGSVSGTQTNKLTTSTNGGTGASWLNDSAVYTTLTSDITGTTNKLCVDSITGFAANQYIDVWDSDTASAQFTILSVNSSDGSCPLSGPSITTTANLTNTNNYTQSKNATVARTTWKQRIIQGAIQVFTQDMPSTTKICVADSSRFSAPTAGTANNIVVWDNNTTTINTNRVVSTSQADGSCTSNNSITISTAITAGTYTTAQSAYVAEYSAHLSNSAAPSNGAVLRWTTFNHPQNPTNSTLLARTTSVNLAYAKSQSPATSSTNYPYLSNRHIFFVAYGDADTTAPADGDIVIVGNGKSDPDSGDSSNLTSDINWATKESHVVTIDRSWDAPMAYSGTNAAAVGDGAGSRANFAAWSQNGGWVSALVTPSSQLGIDNSTNKHYRITIPGKIVVDSDASVALGKSGAAIPESSGHDIYFDTVSPAASTLLTVDSAATTTLTVASTTNFMPGDTIVLDDNNSVPITRIIAAVENSTTITLTAAAVTGYTVAQSAFIAKGPTTELPTGSDRRAGIYTMTGLNGASTPAQSNTRTGRVALYADGSEDFRTSKSDLAVDVDGNIDTGYLGNNSTDAGNTWVDVEDDVVGNWQPLDQVAVAGGTNQLADNNYSSTELGGTDDANQMPVWTGATTKVDAGAGGRNALPTPNMEVAEIGTIPMTNIYNSDYNGGSPLYSSNYNNSSSLTIFNDGANTEVNDAVYFGDQGSNMPYALEFNIGTAMVASADYVWEYYKSGVGWTEFTPRDAYLYQTRTGVTLPLSVDTVNNSLAITLAEGGTVFGLDQIVMIDDNDSDPIYRRLGTSAPTATTLTFSEPVPSGYTVAQGATVTRLNGGQWQSMDPTGIFTSGTGRRIISWTPTNLNGTPAKTTVNGVSAYWVRARISSFTSWTTSPTNQTTPVGMGGIERMSSGVFNVSSGVQEAKVSEVTAGSSFDPNETYILEYGNSPSWTQVLPIVPSAPYTWHINSTGMLSQNTATADFHTANGDLSWGNYTVTAKVQMRTANDATSRKIGVVLRNSLDGNGYGALIEKTSSQQRVGLYPMALGAEGTVFANTTKAFSENSWYWIKANVTGTGASTVLSAKFWADGSGEPGSWDVTYTTTAGQGLWNTGKIGLFADAMIADFDDVSVDNGSVVFSDSFTSTGTWKLKGSINGDLGTITPGTPFTSNYINFTLKHKGGWNGTINPEIGDKIYISPTSTRSYKGLSGTGSSAITTSDTNTVYENVDFEWNPGSSNYTVTGSATGAMGTATPGSAYTATGGKIGLTIPSGSPTATKFGNRMLLLQDNLRRNTGSWVGNNGLGSAALVWPSYTLTSSAITPRYNIEGVSGTATARQNGTIDFWFKANYSGSPSSATHPKGMYLVDYANQGNSERLFIRHTNDGYLEAAVFGGATQNTLLRKSFSATAGQWYHFRLAWDETLNTKRAWLDETAFTSGEGQASTVGTRGANAGIIRIGNTWTYDAPFDGSIDEFAIFDDAIDTSDACDWGVSVGIPIPSAAWTNGQTAGCDDADSNIGTNIFRASFDQTMNPQEGSIMADYAFGNPAMIFTNGADTGNERIRIVTYPQRTRVWVDNTGEKYTPSARIKFGSGYEENATLATLAGWSHNYTYHHKAVRQSSSSPTYSPVLNLKRNTHIWSVEPITQNGATMGAPINAGMGYGMGTIGLSGLGTINFSDVSMENQYTNFAIVTNPFTFLAAKPAQTISNSVFYNFYDRAYTIASKTQGTNYVGAYFVTTHFAAANIGSGYNASLSQNVGIDGSIFMGNRNAYVTVPPVAANGAASFFSGRLYTVQNSEFYNNGVTGAGTSGALNFSSGVAKVTIADNIFSINTNGIRLYGNSFFTMNDNIFEGHVADDVTTLGANYGAGIRVAQTSSSVAIVDTDSIFGRGLWNEADVGLPPNTGTFEAESLIQFTGEGSQLRSPILFGTADYDNMPRVADHYLGSTIPGTDIRGTHSTNEKNIINATTFGYMRTTGAGLPDTLLRTSGGYGWRLEPINADIGLDYTAKLVGVADKPLAATGYLRINSNYGTTNLPTVTLSGLGMTGANLTWTAEPTADEWQQFVVSGTPTESALAELKISTKLDYVVSDSGTSEIVSNATGNYLPALVEDVDKSWTPNQWVGYKFKDANGKVFDIVKNTSQILYLKGTVVPHLLSTTFAALTPGDYVIYNEPYVYLDDVSVLSGTVDTGTLDFHSSGQPVSPWLATGLTAEGVWNAQFSTFSDSAGSFGQLLGDALVAQYADVSDLSPTTTEFDTSLSSTTDDFYLNGAIIFTEGQNKGAVRRISDYTGASKTITVDPALSFAPADEDRFAILAATASSGGSGGGATAAEIWSYAIRRLTDSTLSGGGTLATQSYLDTMKADIIAEIDENEALISGLNDISAADVWSYANRSITDPDAIWEYALTSIGETGSVGKLIKDNLDATISSRGTSDLTAADVWTNATRTLTDYSTDAISLAVWQNATRTLTAYGNDITAADVWNVLSSSLTTVGSIGKQLAENVDVAVSSRASQASLDALNDISAADVWSYSNRTITDPDNIWEYALTSIGETGSVGKLIKDNLDATISSRGTSDLTAADVWLATERTLTSNANFNDPTTAQIATAVWGEANRTLTSYGNDITAADVWSILSSSLTTVGSIGKQLAENVDVATSTRASQSSVDALNDISASDVWTYATRTLTGEVALTSDSRKAIWDTACSILNTSGSVGKLVCDNLDAAVSSRSTLTAADVWSSATRTITNLENPALSAIANSVWSNATRELTAYGNDITAQDVWDVLTSSMTTIDSIGELLITNVDEEISSRSSQSSLDDVSTNVSDIESNVDVPVSTRSSQASLDTHESSESTFRTNTTNTLSDISSDVGDIYINVVAIQSDLSSIDTKIDTLTTTLNSVDAKIDTLDTNIDSIKTTVEDTNIKVSAIQTVTNSILNKWGSYSAADIIGYVDALEDYVGTPDDEASAETLFGRIKEVKEATGSGGTIDLIYAQVQATHNKLLDVELELGYNGKTTSAYDDITAVKNYVDTVENSLATLDSRTSDISSSVSDISSDLKDVTDKIGKVSSDSFSQHFEIKKTDIDYLKNKVIELKAIAEIDRQLIERTISEPIVKVIMEWGSVVIKFIIVNPSDSTDQKIPFKAYLPKEVRQEYIIDLSGLSLNYDATTEQYYVTADIALKAGESVTRAVEIKDIWIISYDEIDSLRKQAEEMAVGLTDTFYNAQAITLKTDINTRLDKVARKQKDNNATPQDHILAYRENQEELKAINENLKGMKDLVLNSGTGKNFLASIGGIQTFATWGIVLILIFGMGALGFFYYALWRKKIVSDGKSETGGLPAGQKTDDMNPVQPVVTPGAPNQNIELPTPSPLALPGFNFSWAKKIVLGLVILSKDISSLIYSLFKKVAAKVASLPKKVLLVIGILVIVTAGTLAFVKYHDYQKEKSEKEKEIVLSVSQSQVPDEADEKKKKVLELVAEIDKKAGEKAEMNKKIDEIMKKDENPEDASQEEKIENKSEASKSSRLTVKDTPTGWLNVRESASTGGNVIGKVYPKESYNYIENQDNWYRIVLKDKKEGWVNGEYVQLEETVGGATTENNSGETPSVKAKENELTIKDTPTGWLNVREQPSASGALVAKIYPGEKYIYLESENGWYKIILKDKKEGWVIGEYVKTNSPALLGSNDNQEKVEGASIGDTGEAAIRQTNMEFYGVYENPSYTEKIIARAYPGEIYSFSEILGGWYKIILKDKKEGWILGEYIEPAGNLENREFVKIIPNDSSYVNIREIPSQSGKVVKKIYVSNQFEKLEEKDGWVKIELLDGSFGWVSNQFAK